MDDKRVIPTVGRCRLTLSNLFKAPGPIHLKLRCDGNVMTTFKRSFQIQLVPPHHGQGPGAGGRVWHPLLRNQRQGRAFRCGHTPNTPHIHPLYTPYTPPIHPLYTPYTPPIHNPYTPYTPETSAQAGPAAAGQPPFQLIVPAHTRRILYHPRLIVLPPPPWPDTRSPF